MKLFSVKLIAAGLLMGEFCETGKPKSSAASAHDQKPPAKLEISLKNKKLVITRGKTKFSIEGVYNSSPPPCDYNLADLYNESTGEFIVPMADFSYRIYDLSSPSGEEFHSVIRGGRAMGMGKWGTARKYWWITGWSGKHLLKVIGERLDESAAQPEALVNLEDMTFRGSDVFRFTFSFGGEGIENDVMYLKTP